MRKLRTWLRLLQLSVELFKPAKSNLSKDNIPTSAEPAENLKRKPHSLKAGPESFHASRTPHHWRPRLTNLRRAYAKPASSAQKNMRQAHCKCPRPNESRSRIRRVKCDEKKPACHRCTSTGRKCDGYALMQKIINPQDVAHGRMILPRVATINSQALLPDEERRALGYFHSVISPRLSSARDGYLWTHLVMQLSESEAVVKHTILSISSLFESSEGKSVAPYTERFALQHYTQAIQRLKTIHSEPLVLLVCILFICVEYLLANNKIALQHCQHGLAIMEKYRGVVFDMTEEYDTVVDITSLLYQAQERSLFMRLKLSYLKLSADFRYKEHLGTFRQVLQLASWQSERSTKQSSFELAYTPILFFTIMKCPDLSIWLPVLRLMKKLGSPTEGICENLQMLTTSREIIQQEHGVEIVDIDISFPRPHT
ncbi:hypothetical protein DER46DRAFT_639667 [Fusarium sp. MPI-SDFR-AT-0072]|nr:hypothetical protein DER46DRAFT_639667 [Fusarium sp. MPI-SDFR-AT-0072]